MFKTKSSFHYILISNHSLQPKPGRLSHTLSDIWFISKLCHIYLQSLLLPTSQHPRLNHHQLFLI